MHCGDLRNSIERTFDKYKDGLTESCLKYVSTRFKIHPVFHFIFLGLEIESDRMYGNWDKDVNLSHHISNQAMHGDYAIQI